MNHYETFAVRLISFFFSFSDDSSVIIVSTYISQQWLYIYLGKTFGRKKKLTTSIPGLQFTVEKDLKKKLFKKFVKLCDFRKFKRVKLSNWNEKEKNDGKRFERLSVWFNYWKSLFSKYLRFASGNFCAPSPSTKELHESQQNVHVVRTEDNVYRERKALMQLSQLRPSPTLSL